MPLLVLCEDSFIKIIDRIVVLRTMHGVNGIINRIAGETIFSNILIECDKYCPII